MPFPSLSDDCRRARLAPPVAGVQPLRMVLDTDTYNEVDDQFALVQALLSPERLEVEAVYAAPFFNARSSGPGDGMEKSYEEICRLLAFLQRTPEGFVFRGATEYLPDACTPVRSDAVDDLVRRALADDERPLYVVAIGAITNIASALLLEPSIIERIVVVWLGGHDRFLPRNDEFNLAQDLHAARLVMDCGVPVVRIPCLNVASHLQTTPAELHAALVGNSALGDYLYEIVASYGNNVGPAWSKVIWDIAAVGWLLCPDWVPTQLVSSPVLREDGHWQEDTSRHLIREATFVHRDPLFADVFSKINGTG